MSQVYICLKILMEQILGGKLPGLNISASNFLDPGEWDSWCVDALVQCACFGEVVYG